MKKLNQVILLLIITISCNTNQERLNDLEKLKLEKDIKSIIIKEFDALEKFGEIVEGNHQTPDAVIKFNENGNILELKDCMLFEENFNNSLRLQTSSITKYLYDGLSLKEKNEYDKNGGLFQKWKYTTDTKGNILKEISYNKLGVENYRYVNKYDKLNNLIESIRYYPNSTKQDKFQYGSNVNDKSEELTNGSDEILSKIKHDDGTFHIYKKGLLIQFNNTVNDYTYKYSFDDNNNWIKRIEFENDKPIKITKREIEYN
jgi:hypothetical protein